MPTEPLHESDRRREPRQTAHGPVSLYLANGTRVAVHGKLLDIAKSGFRARHAMLTLRAGDKVDFELAGLPGRARVVWTRIVGTQVESGFLILDENGQ